MALWMIFSVLSPLLFIIVLEALSREFRTGCPCTVCGRLDDQCWVHGGTAGKGEYLEDRDGEKGPKWLHCTIRFSIDDNVNILSPNSKNVHTKFTKPASF